MSASSCAAPLPPPTHLRAVPAEPDPGRRVRSIGGVEAWIAAGLPVDRVVELLP